MNKSVRNILEDVNLIKKYDQHAFDYIEYPHKRFWNNKISQDDIVKHFEEDGIAEEKPEKQLLQEDKENVSDK